MALTSNQYASLKRTYSAILSGNRYAPNPRVSEPTLLSFMAQLFTTASSSSALSTPQTNALNTIFRSQLSDSSFGIPSAPSVTNLGDFFTQLSTDASGAAALPPLQYAVMFGILRAALSDDIGALASVLPESVIYSYFLMYAGTLRSVATRSRVSGVLAGPSTWMCRSFHFSRDDISQLQVVFGNWYVGNAGDTGTGGTLTVTASVEYPAGTFNQLKFGGSATAVVPDLTTLTSDPLTLSTPVPNGTKFFVRFFLIGAAGVPYYGGNTQYVAGGDAFVFNGTDQTMSGTVTDSGNGVGFFPYAIVAISSKRVIALMGDSRVVGAGDQTLDATGDMGCFERPLAPTYATLNLSRAGGFTGDWLAGAAPKRLALAQAYATDAVCNYGINDLVSLGSSPATLEANLVAIRATLPTLRYFQGTIVVDAASTDNWATLANQTPVAANANRVIVNNWIRPNTGGFTGVIELADVAESSRDSGKWKVDGTPFKYTSDGTGIHESTFTNKQYVIVLP